MRRRRGGSVFADPLGHVHHEAQGASGVSATGKIYKEIGAFRVSITLTGLVPNSAGQATATSTVAEDYGIARPGWYVNVHAGPDLSETEYAPSVSCGDLPAA